MKKGWVESSTKYLKQVGLYFFKKLHHTAESGKCGKKEAPILGTRSASLPIVLKVIPLV